MSVLGFTDYKARDLRDFCSEPYLRSEYDAAFPDAPDGWGSAYAEYAHLCRHEAVWPGLVIKNFALVQGSLDGIESEADLKKTELASGGLLGAASQGAGVGVSSSYGLAVGVGVLPVLPTSSPSYPSLTYVTNVHQDRFEPLVTVPIDASGLLLLASALLIAVIGRHVG